MKIIHLHENWLLRSTRAISALILSGLFVANVSAAQDTGEEEKRNGIELFVGATIDDGDGDSEPSIGLDYERRVSELLGVGVMAEYTEGREWVVAIPFSLHVTESWKAVVAFGAELSPDGDEFLTRLGASYEFGFNGWSLAPELNFDFVDGDVKTVVGVSFGWEF